MEKIVTELPFHTMGLTNYCPTISQKLLLKKLTTQNSNEDCTFLFRFKIKSSLLNFIIKRTVARKTMDTLNANKKKVQKMKTTSFVKNTSKVSKIATGIIFLALIRCICEPFRLQYYSSVILTYTDIKPFLIASLVAALALFAMTILFYFGRHKIIIATCISTIIILLIVKKIYFIP